METRRSRKPLHAGWTLSAAGGPVPAEIGSRPVPASVPGCATTDLLAAGLVPDPYLGDNEVRLAWIGRTHWTYRTAFDADPAGPGERLDLVCDGLDTVATVELNGTVLGRTANMHRSFRWDVGGIVRAEGNQLEVRFEAPVPAAEAMSEALGARPHVNHHPFNAIRKMACSFGWDWGPDLATAGIWKPIGLERWALARLASVRPVVTVTDLERSARPSRGRGHLALHVEVERAPGADEPLDVSVNVGAATATGTVPAGAATATVEVDLPEVELWWPVGYGPQPLYPVVVELAGASAPATLDAWEGRVGFKTVAFEGRPDEVGTDLAMVVNGTEILARGVNWIPEDCFPHRVDRDLYVRRLSDAVEANVNLVRVWGGGIYESDDFYDAADEMGLLVWQDFLFACATYAEEDPLRSEVVAEAREAVTRLMPHVSLAVWDGSNENLVGYEDWGWKEPLGGRTWGAGYYFEVLPAIVAELDPGRPYTPSSPWSCGAEAHPNDSRHGSMHVWDVWNERDYRAYADHRPRFVAEFGFQGPAAWTTLTEAVGEDPLRVDSPVLALHQKAGDGMGKLARGLAAHLPEPRDVEDWHWATSLNQARAVSFGIDRWRSIDPACHGMVVWQLNDCWPVVSWAAVDSAGRRKPLWYALRRSFADRLLTIQPTGDGLEVVAVNDGAEPWDASVELSRQTFDGRPLAKATARLTVPPGGRARAELEPALARADDPRAEVLAAEAGAERAVWLWAEDRDLDLPPPALDTRVEAVTGGYAVTVEAQSLQRDVAILADKAAPGAVVDDMLVTLLPGDRFRFEVRGEGIDPDRLVDPRVLRSVNQLVHPAS